MSDDDGLLGALFASVTRDDAFEAVLDLLMTRFRGGAASLFFRDPIRPEGDIVAIRGLITPEAQRLYREKYGAIDPLPAKMERLPAGTATTTGRIWGDNVVKDPFYTEYFRPLGLAETMAGPFFNEDGRFGLVGVMRKPEREPFDDQDIRDFERLLPNIAQAVRLRSTFFQLQAKAAALESSIEPIAPGIMIFSSDGVLTHANRAAREIVGAHDGLSLDRHGALRASDPEVNRRLAALLPPKVDGAVASTTISVPRRAGPPYALRVISHPSPAWRLQGVGDSSSVVLISDPDRGTAHPIGLLMDIFGLTPASAQLVVALLDGSDLSAYARRSGRSVNTAKFHLKAAFAATGTRRQVDLIRAVNAVVRDLGTT